VTLVVGWVRTTAQGAQELVFASDSRLSGGGSLDCCPKIIQLPRGDSILAFSGDTYFAYPILHQISESISSFRPLADGVVDYVHLRNHILNIMNGMYSQFSAYVKGFENPDIGFLLGGYSWFHKEFHIDKISFRKSDNKFVYRPCVKGIGNFGKVLFSGDWDRTAYKKLLDLLKQRHGHEAVSKESTFKQAFHMEPFEVLRDCLRETGPTDSIGGSPQLVAVAQHMNSRQTAIYWPDKESGRVFLGGRPIFDYEKIDSWIMDPDTFEKDHQTIQVNKFSSSLEAAG